MTKALFIKLHRWVALVSALPLLAVILSGLVLSFEPALKALTPDGSVTLERLERIVAAAGPAGRGGALGSVANLVTSIALVGLLGTGVFIWARRSLAQRRARVMRRRPIASAAG